MDELVGGPLSELAVSAIDVSRRVELAGEVVLDVVKDVLVASVPVKHSSFRLSS
jgi:hypothetical protein